MPYNIAGIDVHKRILHVVISDVEIDGEYAFTRQIFSSSPEALRSLAAWLVEHQVEEVVMESTAQYWKPVWGALERYGKPICQRLSNRGRRGRKKDFRDAERLVKRLVANELILSFVPDAEQRLWRTVMRTKYQLTRNRVQLQNRWEALLEEAHIKLSSLVSDLLGVSARRMLKAIAEGERTQRLWLPWPMSGCGPSRNRYVMHWACVRNCPPCTGGSSRWRWKSQHPSTSGLTNSSNRWPICSVHTRAKSRDWRRYPAWEWIPHSRSLPKPAPQQPPSLPRSISPRGLAHVPAMRRARK
jgi:hypothetical protein